MIVGGYTLHLYCDLAGCIREESSSKPGEFYAQTYWQAKKIAKKAGWRFFNSKVGKPATVHCPECSRKKK